VISNRQPSLADTDGHSWTLMTDAAAKIVLSRPDRYRLAHRRELAVAGHGVIDNRNEKLVDHINRILASAKWGVSEGT